jgi:hypothetical protein
MKTPRLPLRPSSLSVLGAAGLVLAILAAVPDLAQAAPTDAAIRPGAATAALSTQPALVASTKAVVNPAELQVNAKPAIAFTPFPVVDPNTMMDPRTRQRLTPKPLAAGATLTLPSGKVVDAQTYYSQLNTVEQWLSQHGYSLHDTPNNSQIELARIPVDTAALDQQSRAGPAATSLPARPEIAALAATRPVAMLAPLKLDPNAAAAQGVRTTLSAAQIADINKQVSAAGIQSETVDGLNVSPAALSAIAKLNLAGIVVERAPNPCTPVSGSRSWGWNVGSSHFDAYLNGSISLTGEACKPTDMSNFAANNSTFDVHAAGAAGGHVFGAGGDLLRITGDLKGNEATNQITTTLNVWLAGSTVYNLNKTSPTWTEGNNFNKNIDFSASTTIMVGPIPLDLKIGAHGSAGLQYSMKLTPMSVSLSGGPTVNASVYGQAGVDLVVASAGVNVSMTLVNWKMNFSADAGLGWLFGFYVYDDIYADSNLNMLSGSAGLYANVTYPCWSIPPWCTSGYSDNLFSWSGLKYNSVLFNDRNIVALKW